MKKIIFTATLCLLFCGCASVDPKENGGVWSRGFFRDASRKTVKKWEITKTGERVLVYEEEEFSSVSNTGDVLKGLGSIMQGAWRSLK